MLTIADTDAALKKCESHIQWATIENKAGLVATTTDNLEIIALKAKVAQLESNVAINAGPAVKRKRHDNNKKTAPKAIATCTVCQKTGHKAEVCWFGAENKIRDAELALAKAKSEGAPILNTKRATASERKVLAAGVVTNTSNSSADSPYSLTCQLPASRVPIASACTPTLYKGYSTTAEALVTTLSLRQRAKTAVLDQMFVPGTNDSILDSGAMAPIIEGTKGTGARVRLVGVTGTGVDAELADVIFPVRTATELYAIDTTGSQAGSTLLVERTKDTILSLVSRQPLACPKVETPNYYQANHRGPRCLFRRESG
jgi:hypothetical protein